MCNSVWLLLLIAAFSGCVVIAQGEYLPIWICLWHQCGEALTGCYLILVMFSSPVMELCSLRSRLQLSITEPSSKRNTEALWDVWSQQRKVACFWRSVLSCAKLGKPYPFARKDCVASKTTTACGERITLKIRSACTHNNHSIYMMFFFRARNMKRDGFVRGKSVRTWFEWVDWFLGCCCRQGKSCFAITIILYLDIKSLRCVSVYKVRLNAKAMSGVLLISARDCFATQQY